MNIDSFSFGNITVDGVKYVRDLLLLPPRIVTPWWRGEGHRLATEDLTEVLAYRPEVLIVGCGVSKMMRVQHGTLSSLEAYGIAVETLATGEAVGRFNVLSGPGKKVAAALHLTC